MNSNNEYHLVVLQFGTHTKSEVGNYMRPLGAEKISWAAQCAGYNAIAITRLQTLTPEEIYTLVTPYISKYTVVGISTSLMTGMYYDDREKLNLLNFSATVAKLIQMHKNTVILGGQSANEFINLFPNSISLENFDGENDIIDFLNKKFNYGISKNNISRWTIHNDDFIFPTNSYVQKEEILPLELSRGCIFSCKFCSFSRIGKEKGSYEKDIQNVKKYIIDNYEKYGTQHYFITSDTVNDNNERMNQWCDMLESLPFSIYYAGYFRIDLMNKYIDTTKRLYETGLRGINFGIETFHPEAGKIIEKPFTGQRAKDLLLRLHYDIFEKNVNISIGMIVGLPGEPVSSIYESAKWLSEDGAVITANFNPLTLVDPARSSQSAHYSSKFSRNADRYGLVWPDKNNPLYWEHELLNFKRAHVIAKKINTSLDNDSNGKIGPWNHVQKLACGGNYEFIKNYFESYKKF